MTCSFAEKKGKIAMLWNSVFLIINDLHEVHKKIRVSNMHR